MVDKTNRKKAMKRSEYNAREPAAPPWKRYTSSIISQEVAEIL